MSKPIGLGFLKSDAPGILSQGKVRQRLVPNIDLAAFTHDWSCMAVALRSGGEGRVGAQVRGESLEPQEPKGTTSTQHTRSASEQAQVTGWLGPWRTCCQQE
jgi:hypothetical protein